MHQAEQVGTNEQAFSYKVNQFTPEAPVVGFISHLAKRHYAAQDEKTLEVIRRNIGEFTNDNQVRINANIFTAKARNGSGDLVMNEQYVARSLGGDRMFSITMLSADEIEIPEFDELPQASLHVVKKADKRFYVGEATDIKRDGEGLTVEVESVQFVSIHHQLQNLVRSLSDKCTFYVHYNQKKEQYFLFARPSDQVAIEKAGGNQGSDRFQVLIVLNIPTALSH